MKYQLKKKIFIEGEIEALTGFRVGGSTTAMSIGGIDNAVIRNPIDNKPYIPGSSLKGKMRSLMELRDGLLGEKQGGNVDHGPSQDADKIIGKIFGTASGSSNNKSQPSCIIVRDAFLKNADEIIGTDLPYTEVKTEVVIDRVTAAANPRSMERVPAGAKFNLNIVLNIFEKDGTDQEAEIVKELFNALTLLQDDYIGGSGSRGYGQIKIKIEKVLECDAKSYKENATKYDYKIEIPEHLKSYESKSN